MADYDENVVEKMLGQIERDNRALRAALVLVAWTEVTEICKIYEIPDKIGSQQLARAHALDDLRDALGLKGPTKASFTAESLVNTCSGLLDRFAPKERMAIEAAIHEELS